MTDRSNQALLDCLIKTTENTAQRIENSMHQYSSIPHAEFLRDLWPALYGAASAHADNPRAQRLMKAIKTQFPHLGEARQASE